MEIRERFVKKIYEELQVFQNEVQSKGKKSIPSSSRKSEILMELYSILLDVADDISENLLTGLVNQSVNILESLYSDFADECMDEAFHEELRAHVKKEFEDYETEEYGWWNNPDYMEVE